MTKKEIMKMSARELNDAVRIAGTNYDRRRKVKLEDIPKMKQMFKKGKSFDEIGNKFKVSGTAVKYNIDESYREHMINYKTAAPTGGGVVTTAADRAEYKRTLLLAGVITADR